MELVNVKKVIDDGNHNAFTDLVRFNDDYYLTFRKCPDGHMIFSSSHIMVMRSKDGETWQQVHSFNADRRDVRDPHFLNTGDRLFVYSGAWPVDEKSSHSKDYGDMRSYYSFTVNGDDWCDPVEIEGSKGYYYWRTAKWNQNFYMCGKRYWKSEGFCPSRDPDGRKSVLLTSKDGCEWKEQSIFLSQFGDETAFIIDDNGKLTAIVRTVGGRPAYLCRSQFPFEDWERTKLSINIGGPLLVKLDDRLLVAGRRHAEEGPRTTLFWLEDDQLHQCLTLPSGGDNSYPGFVELEPGLGLLSYYSTHEAHTNIYLAKIKY